MNRSNPLGPLVVLVAALGPGVSGTLSAQETIRLQERFPVGYQYRVQTRVTLSGTLSLPAQEGKPAPKPLAITGDSAIDYDEKVLALDRDGVVNRTVRLFRRMDFERQMSEQKQKGTLRPEVRRMVLMRHDSSEVAFSPDGPLLWGELDLIRTDVFTPGLLGLLPEREVRLNERWKATGASIRELTDLEQIDEGGLECRLEQLFTAERRRYARVSFSGSVKGMTEDGPTRQQLEGYYFFDRESNHLSYLYLKGRHVLVDKDGKEAGKVEGRFTLTRQAPVTSTELSEQALKGIALEPNNENTRLLYDNPDLGVRLVHPRRWRVATVQGRQLALDSPDGSGVLFTLDPLTRIPTGAQFQSETKDFLLKQKGRILSASTPRVVQDRPTVLEQFTLETEMNKQRLVMVYYIIRQKNGGATVAARFLPETREVLEKELDKIVRSLTITKPIK